MSSKNAFCGFLKYNLDKIRDLAFKVAAIKMKSIEKMMNIKALWHDMHYKIGLAGVGGHNTQHEHSTSFKAQTANGFRYNFIGVYELAMQQLDWISDINTLLISNSFPLRLHDQCSTDINGESFQPNFRGNFSSSCIHNKPFKPPVSNSNRLLVESYWVERRRNRNGRVPHYVSILNEIYDKISDVSVLKDLKDSGTVLFFKLSVFRGTIVFKCFVIFLMCMENIYF